MIDHGQPGGFVFKRKGKRRPGPPPDWRIEPRQIYAVSEDTQLHRLVVTDVEPPDDGYDYPQVGGYVVDGRTGALIDIATPEDGFGPVGRNAGPISIQEAASFVLNAQPTAGLVNLIPGDEPHDDEPARAGFVRVGTEPDPVAHDGFAVTLTWQELATRLQKHAERRLPE